MAPQFGGDPISDNAVGVIAILSIFVFFPVAIALGRFIWRRGSMPESRPVQSDETARRLIEMQHSIDAMAVEIERISEGQRFVTKVLSERPSGALPAGTEPKPAKRA